MRSDKIRLSLIFICWAATVGLFIAGYWLAAFGLFLAVLLAWAIYWRTPGGRARRISGEPVVIDLGGGGVPGVVLLLLGLGGLVLVVRGLAAGDAVGAVVGGGPFTLGCLALAFRLLTYARLSKTLGDGTAASPIVVGTGESFFSRLRALTIEQDELVTVHASVLGKPQGSSHIPLDDVSAVEEPDYGAVEVTTRNGTVLSVKRGSPEGTKELARRIEDLYREAVLQSMAGSEHP